MSSFDLLALGQRLTAARGRAGLKQSDLAEATALSQPTISRIEKGTADPKTLTVTVLTALAQATGLTIEHLVLGSPVADRVRLAARTPGPEPLAGAELSERASEVVALLELEDLLESRGVPGGQIAVKTLNPTVQGGSASAQGKRLAQQVRTECGLGFAPIADIAELLTELTGTDVAFLELEGVSGLTAVDDVTGTTLVCASTKESPERQRFTLAHELCHLLLNEAHNSSSGGTSSAVETRAETFARHLLIPEDGVRHSMNRYLPQGQKFDDRHAARLAQHFGVSPTAAWVQLRSMRVLAAEGEAPTARSAARMYGWSSERAAQEIAARQRRIPARIEQRAQEAYRESVVGLGVLARLTGENLAEIAERLDMGRLEPHPAPEHASC